MPCDKKRFASRAEAKTFAAARLKRNGRQRPYRCDDPTCVEGKFWHLTSQSTEHVTFYRTIDRGRRDK